MSKYGNQKTVIDGIRFDSKHEASRYIELKYMERAGLIKDLLLQQRFELIPEIRDCHGRVKQRPVYYVADFCYSEKDGDGWRRVVEDAKGYRTQVYKLKKKIMLWKYNIDLKET